MLQSRPLELPANRLHRLHAVSGLDLRLNRKSLLAPPRVLLIALGVIAFFAFVFNVKGLQSYLTGLLGEAGRTAGAHSGLIAIHGLTYLAVAVGSVSLFVLMTLGLQAARHVRRERKHSRNVVIITSTLPSGRVKSERRPRAGMRSAFGHRMEESVLHAGMQSNGCSLRPDRWQTTFRRCRIVKRS